MFNNNKWALATLATFAVVALLHLLKAYGAMELPSDILMGSRFLLITVSSLFAFQKKDLTTWILVAMVIGVEIGIDFPDFSKNLQFLSTIFLRMVKTIVAPLLFATLVVGIAAHSNLKQVGRMGWKSLLYFELVTTVALFIGLLAINITGAGKDINIPKEILKELPKSPEKQLQAKVISIIDSAKIAVPPNLINKLPDTPQKTWQEHIIDIFPENIIKSIYEGNVLPIVIFSILFGISLAMLPEQKKRPMIEFAESLAEVMFKLTSLIMYFAPFGVGAAIAVTIGNLGVGILANLLYLLATLYLALIVFILAILLPIAWYIKIPIRNFVKAISEPVSIAFATTSSDSALPKALANMERFGVPRHIVSFVIPTGYTFNLDGTTLYLSLASIFVMQAAGMDWGIGEQLLIGFSLMLTSKGVAAVPRASLVILIATAATFKMPMWPIMAIYGIDALMDMARTSVNVIGNTLASCVIARWEGEFNDEKAAAYTDK
jgi:proton glutamate symport protein